MFLFSLPQIPLKALLCNTEVFLLRTVVEEITMKFLHFGSQYHWQLFFFFLNSDSNALKFKTLVFFSHKLISIIHILCVSNGHLKNASK